MRAGAALTGMTHSLGHQLRASANVYTKNYGEGFADYRFSGSFGVSATLYHDWVPSDESHELKNNIWRGWLGRGCKSK